MSARRSARRRRRTSGAPGRLAGLLVVALLLGLTAWSVAALQPPDPLPLTAPADAVQRRPGPSSTCRRSPPRPTSRAAPANDRVVEGLVATLTGLGLDTRVQNAVGTWQTGPGETEMARVRNVVAVLPGSDSTGRLFLMAHHDSVETGPGAADDAAGVSVAARDGAGAEPGAAAAQRRRRRAHRRRGGLPLRRGGVRHLAPAGRRRRRRPQLRGPRAPRGPPIMFETSRGNADLAGAFAAAAPHPVASSFAVEVYRALPNDTDFSVLLGDGDFTGLNTAFIDGAAAYHTPQDTPDRLDRGTLQAMGDNALAVTRELAGRDLGALAQPGAEDATLLPGARRARALPRRMGLAAGRGGAGRRRAAGRGRRRGAARPRRAGRPAARRWPCSRCSSPRWPSRACGRCWWRSARTTPRCSTRGGRAGSGWPPSPSSPPWCCSGTPRSGAGSGRGRWRSAGCSGWRSWPRSWPPSRRAAPTWRPGRPWPGRSPASSRWRRPPGVVRAVAALVGGAVAVVVLAPTVALFFPALGLSSGAAPAFVATMLAVALLPAFELLFPDDELTPLGRGPPGRGRRAGHRRRRGRGLHGRRPGRRPLRRRPPRAQPARLRAGHRHRTRRGGPAPRTSPAPTPAATCQQPGRAARRLPLPGRRRRGVGSRRARRRCPPPVVETLSDTVVGENREITVRVTPQRTGVRLLALDLSVEGGTVVRGRVAGPGGRRGGAGGGPALGDLPRAPGRWAPGVVHRRRATGRSRLRVIDGSDGLDGLPGFEPRPEDVDAAGTHSSDLVVVAGDHRAGLAGHCSGNGGCTHQGASTTSTRRTHLTHQKPRRPGATEPDRRAVPERQRFSARPGGEQQAAGVPQRQTTPEAGLRDDIDAAVLGQSSPASSASRRSSRIPAQSCSAYHPPVQSRTARTRSPRSRSATGIRRRRPPTTSSIVSGGRLGHRVGEPLGDGHRGRVAGAELVRAGGPPPRAGRAGQPERPLAHGPERGGAETERRRPQQRPAGEVGAGAGAAARPRRARRAAGGAMTAAATCRVSALSPPRAGQGPPTPTTCSTPVATVRTTLHAEGDRRGRVAPGQRSPAGPPDHHGLPRHEQQQAEPGRPVDGDHPPGRPGYADPVGQDAGAAGEDEQAQQPEVGPPPRPAGQPQGGGRGTQPVCAERSRDRPDAAEATRWPAVSCAWVPDSADAAAPTPAGPPRHGRRRPGRRRPAADHAGRCSAPPRSEPGWSGRGWRPTSCSSPRPVGRRRPGSWRARRCRRAPQPVVDAADLRQHRRVAAGGHSGRPPTTSRTVAVVGHNPSIGSSRPSSTTVRADRTARRRSRRGFPTGGVAVFSAPRPFAALEPGAATLNELTVLGDDLPVSVERRSPAAAVHDLVDAAPAATQRGRPPVVGARVADRHAADGPEVLGHAERLPERGQPLRRDAEEAGAQPLVDGGEQHQQRGHAGVDVPVGHRPAASRRGRSSPCPARRSGRGRRSCSTSARSAAARGASGSASRRERPSSVVAVQNRSRSSGDSSTRNAQPWLKPADGARIACSSSRSRTSGGTGRSGS